MSHLRRIALIAALVLVALPPAAPAQERRGPARFDARGNSADAPAAEEGAAGGDAFGQQGSDGARAQDQGRPEALKREDIMSRIQGRQESFNYCYESALKVDKTAQGRVLLNWKIALDGKVTDLTVKASTFKAEKPDVKKKFEECLVDKVKQLVFPARRRGIPMDITFPFVFKPKA